MLLKLGQWLYWLTSALAITLFVTAGALAFDVSKSDGFENYAVAIMMGAAAIAIWLFGRAVFRLAQ